jgi:hypothetical protein
MTVSRADELVTKADAHFTGKSLSVTEKALLRAAAEGIAAICSPKRADRDAVNDPAKADNWGSEREIRADLIRWMCVEREASNKIDPAELKCTPLRSPVSWTSPT